MRVVVVGAGAWGLPAAVELTRRGHSVTLVDRHGPGNAESSSSGPTRLWRVADPEPAAIRLGRRAVDAMHRLERRTGRPLHTTTGLLWRDGADPLRQIAGAAAAEGVTHTEVPAADVGDVFAGLAPDGRDALWFPEAGSLLASDLISGCLDLLLDDGGQLVVGSTVTSVRTSPSGAVVALDDGRALDADAVVVCAGPGTPALLPGIGLDVPLRPYLEQVVHVGRSAKPDAAHDALPCLFDGPVDGAAGIYSMPTPGVGYKVGLDQPLRELLPGDDDRTPDPRLTDEILARTLQALPSLGQGVVDELVCCWTDSPDGWFVVDRVGSVVVACGDSGKGFKYAPALGEILADLVEGAPPEPDVAAMSARRFAELDPDAPWSPTSLGGTLSPDRRA